jgi:hypothetical protein
MIQMAHDKVYDLGVLLSADADLCGAVEFIQQRMGVPVYNVWFPNVGIDLRNTCWGHLAMSDLLSEFGLSDASDAE